MLNLPGRSKGASVKLQPSSQMCNTEQTYSGEGVSTTPTEATAKTAPQTAQNRDLKQRPTLTSTGKDYSKSIFWSFSLEVESRAERSEKQLPLMLSGAEIALDAFQYHRNKLMEEFEELFDAWVKDDGATIEGIKNSLSQGDFIRGLHEIKYLNNFIDGIAYNIAADLREIGNSLLKEEVSHE